MRAPLVDLQRRVERVEEGTGRRLPALRRLVGLWLRCGQAIAGLVEGVRQGPGESDPAVWAERMLYHEENFFLRVQQFAAAIDAAAKESGAGGDFVLRAKDGAGVPPQWHEAGQAVRQLHNPLLRHLCAVDSVEQLRRVEGREPVVDGGYVSLVLDELLPVYEELHAMTAAIVEAAERAGREGAEPR